MSSNIRHRRLAKLVHASEARTCPAELLIAPAAASPLPLLSKGAASVQHQLRKQAAPRITQSLLACITHRISLGCAAFFQRPVFSRRPPINEQRGKFGTDEDVSIGQQRND